MWDEAKADLETAIRTAIQMAHGHGALPIDTVETIPLDRPATDEHGDLATPVALGLARDAKMAPRKIAEAIVAHLVADEDIETPGGRRRIRRGVCRDCGSETSQFVASA